MRPAILEAPPLPGAAAPPPRSDWVTLKKLVPYVWQWRWRVLLALSFLVAAKLANIGVPLVLKQLVDALDLKPGDPRVALAVPVALLLDTVRCGCRSRSSLNCASSCSTRWPRASQGAFRSKPSSTCWR